MVGREIGRAVATQEREPLPLQVCIVLRAAGRGRDVHHVAVAAAAMRVLDRMHDVAVPEHRVARFHVRDRHQCVEQQRVPFGADRQRAAGTRAAQVVVGDVVLQRAQHDIGHRVRDRDQLQRAVAGPLRRQRGPALERAEHRTHGRRRNLLDVGAERRIERIVIAPAAGQHVAIDLAEIRAEPALDGAAVDVRRQPERRRPGRPATNPVRIGGHLVGIEMRARTVRMPPQTVQEHPRLRERRRLARGHLRLRPVDAVDLRLARREVAEIAVFRARMQPLGETVRIQIRADLVVPVACLLRIQHAADHDRAVRADRGNRERIDGPARDIRERHDRNHVIAMRVRAADRVDLPRDVALHFAERGRVAGQVGA